MLPRLNQKPADFERLPLDGELALALDVFSLVILLKEESLVAVIHKGIAHPKGHVFAENDGLAGSFRKLGLRDFTKRFPVTGQFCRFKIGNKLDRDPFRQLALRVMQCDREKGSQERPAQPLNHCCWCTPARATIGQGVI